MSFLKGSTADLKANITSASQEAARAATCDKKAENEAHNVVNRGLDELQRRGELGR